VIDTTLVGVPSIKREKKIMTFSMIEQNRTSGGKIEEKLLGMEISDVIDDVWTLLTVVQYVL
jgi:hypothetical protein